MKTEVSQRLIQINNVFYQNFGAAFAATRRRIQPGIRRILQQIPLHGNWLDLGCGSGALALEWVAQKRSGAYDGLDFSQVLLNEAQQSLSTPEHPNLNIHFIQADLGGQAWPEKLQNRPYDGVLCFAALHHIPDADLRLNILKLAHDLIKAQGLFIHSEWQFQHSPRLTARCLPWSVAGLDQAELDEGDTLLDWRYALPGQTEKVGLRYVHCFEHNELLDLAEKSGFKIIEEFDSDGAGGRLGLYQVWQKVG